MDSQPRKVLEIVEPQPVVEGAGVRLKRVFPTGALDYPDPFLLFDHFGSDNPDDYLAGFPMHPHRGIETVTYMLTKRCPSNARGGWPASSCGSTCPPG
jgi:redox-sensitive bicupin YhaK (pirin superfamily)